MIPIQQQFLSIFLRTQYIISIYPTSHICDSYHICYNNIKNINKKKSDRIKPMKKQNNILVCIYLCLIIMGQAQISPNESPNKHNSTPQYISKMYTSISNNSEHNPSQYLIQQVSKQKQSRVQNMNRTIQDRCRNINAQIKSTGIQQNCYLQSIICNNYSLVYIGIKNSSQNIQSLDLFISLSQQARILGTNMNENQKGRQTWIHTENNICKKLNSNKQKIISTYTYNQQQNSLHLYLGYQKQTQNGGNYSYDDINGGFALALFIVSCIVLMCQLGYLIHLFFKKCKSRGSQVRNSQLKGSVASSKFIQSLK